MNEVFINEIERAKWNKMHMDELCHNQGLHEWSCAETAGARGEEKGPIIVEMRDSPC